MIIRDYFENGKPKRKGQFPVNNFLRLNHDEIQNLN